MAFFCAEWLSSARVTVERRRRSLISAHGLEQPWVDSYKTQSTLKALTRRTRFQPPPSAFERSFGLVPRFSQARTMGWNWLTPSALNSLRHTTHDAKIRYAIQFTTLHNSRHRPWEARLTSEFESLESTLLRSGSSSVVEHRLAKARVASSSLVARSRY